MVKLLQKLKILSNHRHIDTQIHKQMGQTFSIPHFASRVKTNQLMLATAEGFAWLKVKSICKKRYGTRAPGPAQKRVAHEIVEDSSSGTSTKEGTPRKSGGI